MTSKIFTVNFTTIFDIWILPGSHFIYNWGLLPVTEVLSWPEVYYKSRHSSLIRCISTVIRVGMRNFDLEFSSQFLCGNNNQSSQHGIRMLSGKQKKPVKSAAYVDRVDCASIRCFNDALVAIMQQDVRQTTMLLKKRWSSFLSQVK